MSGGVVLFREERFSDLRDEGAALFAEHWRAANSDPDIGLDQDWERYRAMEDLGFLVTVTARADGLLVGYASYAVTTMLHARTVMVADQVHYWLAPEHRRGSAGTRLIRVAEEAVRRRGATMAYARTLPNATAGRWSKPLDGLFALLGYRQAERCLVRRLAA